MSTKENVPNRPMSRRGFVKTGVAAAAAVAVAGVGYYGYTQLQPKPTPVEPLNVWGVSVFDIGKYWEYAKTESKVSVNFTDNGYVVGPIENRLVSGDAEKVYDVLVHDPIDCCGSGTFAEKGLVKLWDTTKISNWNKLYDWAKATSRSYAAPYGGTNDLVYQIPVISGADSFGYLWEKTGELDSFGALFDPQWKGKTGMGNDYPLVFGYTAMYLHDNHMATYNEPFDAAHLDPDGIRETGKFLLEKKKEGQFRAFWDSVDQAVNLMLSDEVWVLGCWEPIQWLANQKAGYDKVHYADAREGWWAWMAGLYLLKGAVDRGEQDACYRFAEFVTSGLYGAATGTLFGYAHMNAATPDYAKAHEQDMGFNAAAVEKRNKDENAKHTAGKPVYWRTMFQDYLDIYEQEWTKISSA